MGIIPTFYKHHIDERKATRKRIKMTDDENKKKVLDGFSWLIK